MSEDDLETLRADRRNRKMFPLYLEENLKERIKASAKADRRTISQQIQALAEEALEARERKAG